MPVPTADEINEAHRLAETNAKFAVDQAILCGNLLLKKKATLDHGKFESWCEEWTTFGVRRAQIYMKAAKAKSDGIAFDSLRSLFPKLKATPRTFENQPKSDEKRSALRFCDEKPAESSSKPETNGHADYSKSDTDNVVSGGSFDDEEALAADMHLQFEQEYQASIDKVMAADDKLAAAHAEIKRQAHEIASLKISRDGYLNKCGSLSRLLAKVQKKNEQLERRH